MQSPGFRLANTFAYMPLGARLWMIGSLQISKLGKLLRVADRFGSLLWLPSNAGGFGVSICVSCGFLGIPKKGLPPANVVQGR
jgi:hypothetical protein